MWLDLDYTLGLRGPCTVHIRANELRFYTLNNA